MFKLFGSDSKIDYETKMFWLMVLFYGLILVVSTVYVYARLNYVRSANNEQQVKDQNIQ
jgi:heme/copper-type cytochrome/quinol oxidase subunit 2